MTELKPGIDFVGVGVGVMVRNEKGKFLLGLRTKNSRNEAGKWTFPGGCVEFGETLEQAVVRETREEYGIEVEPLRLLKVINHFPPAEKQHWVNPIFEARLVKGKPKTMEPNKISKVAWFSLTDLPENITINLAELFNDIKDGIIKLD